MKHAVYKHARMAQGIKQFLHRLRSPSLSVALILPWSSLMLGTVSLVGYLSYRNGQQASALLSYRLHENLSAQVQQHLGEYLQAPPRVNRLYANAQQLGLINLQDFPATAKAFWQQMRFMENLSYLSYGNTEGEFIGIERLDDGKLVMNEVRKATKLDKLYIYSMNDRGERQKRLEVKTWSPRAEPWYQETMAAKKPIWSSIFQWLDKPEVMSVTANHPIFSKDKQIQGVLSIDLTLTQIHRFLKNLPINQASRVFLIERSGLLISSGSDTPLAQVQPIMRRLPAVESEDYVIRSTAQHLQKTFQDWHQIQQQHQAKFDISGKPYFVQATPWDIQGLNWLIVVVTPEADFMQPIYDNTRTTIILCGIATLGAVTLSIWLAQWLTKPIKQLNLASKTIAAGDLNQPIQTTSGSQESLELSQTFEQMRGSLFQAQSDLRTYAQSLEHRVQERTTELQASNAELATTLRDLQNAQNHLVQSEKLAALGQLVASVAHEINTPLGVIQSSVNNILNCLREDLEKLPNVLQALSGPQQTAFFQLLQRSIESMPQLSLIPKEEQRRLRRTFVEQFQQGQIDHADYIADTLVDLGIHGDIQAFECLLQDHNARGIIDAIYGLASSQQSALTITRATNSASTFVLALKSYSYRDETDQKVAVDLVASLELSLIIYKNLMKRGITILRRYPDQVPQVAAVPTEIEQVWTNLIRNAIQAMDYQGTLEIAIVPQGDQVQVSITDSGPGIPPEVMARIFEPFFTTKAQGEGSGLGLSIVQKLLERHGGTIGIESRPGCTRVQVCLPIINTESL